MIDISIQHLKKSYEDGVEILRDLTFDIQSGEHVAILGPNGCGKTTIFRILSGEIDYDDGAVLLASGKRLGLISQIPVYPPDYTTEDVLRTAHRRLENISARLEQLTQEMAENAAPEVLREYDRLSAEFERLGGWNADVARDKVANGLDIPAAMRAQKFDSLSGGEKTRVNLARLILEDTDILLLDEPTNHLDLHATEWLEDYVLHFHGTVLAISHDRWFLDTVAQRCIEIKDGAAEFYAGNYSFYVEERQRRFEEQLKKYEKDQAKYEQLKRAAEQMHLWAFMGADKLHKRAFSMEKRMEKLAVTEKPRVQKKLDLRFAERDFFGDEVVLVENLGKRFGEKVLFHDLDLLVEGCDRIALIGDNGSGKSTFLKILMDEESADAGRVHIGPSVKIAYLPQIIRFAHPERTLYDTMLYEENCLPQTARDRLAQFRFTGEDVFKPVSALSGGELSRLRLCMLMRHDINFLILDEPTNHLDIASREWIEDAVEDYGGALLFVSHDRWFIERFANRIWELKDGEITDFRGSFTQYREYKARQQSITAAEKKKQEKTEAPAKPEKRQPQRTERQLARIEREIGKLEEQLAALDRAAAENASDYQKLMEIDEEKAALNAQLDALYAQWEEIGE